jgi:hypothetical protein
MDGSGEVIGSPKNEMKWFIRKKHRKVARMEFIDALELRDRLVWGVGAVFLVVLAGSLWGMIVLLRRLL